MDQEQALAIVRDYIASIRTAGYRVVTAYLFGSVAKGCADSDIDVALLIDGLGNSFDAQVELMKQRRTIDLRIEPHPVSATDDQDAFLREIEATGVRVA